MTGPIEARAEERRYRHHVLDAALQEINRLAAHASSAADETANPYRVDVAYQLIRKLQQAAGARLSDAANLYAAACQAEHLQKIR